MESPFFTIQTSYLFSALQNSTAMPTKMVKTIRVFTEKCWLLLAFVGFWKPGSRFLEKFRVRSGLDEKVGTALQPGQSFVQRSLLPLRPLRRGALIVALRKLIGTTCFKVLNRYGFKPHFAFTYLVNRPGGIYS